MILWHLGATLAGVRYVFRDPAMDLRWVAVGSLLPDLIDKPIGSIMFHDVFGTHRLVAHAMVFPVVGLGVVLLVTRRRSVGRSAAIGVVIGSLFHLILDGAWADPAAFWWPLLGYEFPEVADSAFGPLLRRMVADPWVWAGEAVGAAYLVYLWRRWITEAGGPAAVWRSGRIPQPPRPH
jgi:hypothetical protein